MKYICNVCGNSFDDDELTCVYESKDISELSECIVCNGEYRVEDIENGICYNCKNDM